MYPILVQTRNFSGDMRWFHHTITTTTAPWKLDELLNSGSCKSNYHVITTMTFDYAIGICCFSTKRATWILKARTGWLRIRVMCPSGATCLHIDCCFSELALQRSNSRSTALKASKLTITPPMRCFKVDQTNGIHQNYVLGARSNLYTSSILFFHCFLWCFCFFFFSYSESFFLKT
jgi:hypothetical protein